MERSRLAWPLLFESEELGKIEVSLLQCAAGELESFFGSPRPAGKVI